MSIYPLKAVLATFTKGNGKKRILYNLAPVGGISSAIIVFFLLSLPFIEFAAIFNPFVFNKLGIAQSIIFFIVFLSIVMIIVFVVSWRVNKAVLNKIDISWKHYFPAIELKWVLSSGVSPYSGFFDAYAKLATSDEEELHKGLQEAFVKMQDENKELIEAMQRDRQA